VRAPRPSAGRAILRGSLVLIAELLIIVPAALVAPSKRLFDVFPGMLALNVF